MKNTIISILVLLLLGGGLYFYIQSTKDTPEDLAPTITDANDLSDEPMPVEPDGGIGDGAEPLPEVEETEKTVGNSIKGTPITAHHYGTGDTEVLIVAGVHGGYAPNTTLLAYEMMDYFDANPTSIPDDVRVTIVPVLNPDGLERVVGTTGRFTIDDVTGDQVQGRFNSNDVDLNRNFDCQWQAEGTWRSQTVSGGSEPFSEPESKALRNFVRELEPDAVVVYYAAAGGVYASSCNGAVSAETLALTNTYADASDYEANEEFDFYELNGDMVNWMASQNIPAISVLLTDRTSTELSKNQAGVMAVLNSVSE